MQNQLWRKLLPIRMLIREMQRRMLELMLRLKLLRILTLTKGDRGFVVDDEEEMEGCE